MNFIGNLFTSFFRMFGLFKKDAKIIFVGLDDAGKTSLMSVLKYGSIRQYDPTIHAHAEEIEIGKKKVDESLLSVQYFWKTNKRTSG